MNKERFNVGQRVNVIDVNACVGKRTRIGTILKVQRTRCHVAIDGSSFLFLKTSVPKSMLMGDPFEQQLKLS